MAAISFIKIAGDRWNIPPRVNNRFPIKANFGEGVTLFDVSGKLWLPLDAEGYVDVTPGHNYLVVKLCQATVLQKSQEVEEERKAKRVKEESNPRQPTAQTLFFRECREKFIAEGRPANDFKELHRLWKELPEVEKEKLRKLAAVKKEISHEGTSSSSSSTSTSQSNKGTVSSEKQAEKVSKSKKQKHNEKEPDNKDGKKKSSKHSETSAVVGTPQTLTAQAGPASSQKPKEKHTKVVDTPKPSTSSNAVTATTSSSQKQLPKPAPVPAPIHNEFANESSDEESDLGSEDEL